MNEKRFSGLVFYFFFIIFVFGSITIILEFLGLTHFLNQYDIFWGPVVLGYMITPLLLLFGLSAFVLQFSLRKQSKKIAFLLKELLILLVGLVLILVVFTNYL